MTDVFREVRESVSAEDAARFYGLRLDRRGKALCPFHSEKTPSMSFKNGRFKCFGCGVSGDSIDLTARLLGLDALDAVRRLNSDFKLRLPLDRKPTPAESQEAEKRRETVQAYRDFELWRGDFIRYLNAAFRVGFLVQKDFPGWERLTEYEALAVKWQSAFEHWSDCLSYGDMSEQMSIFHIRKELERLCEKVLSSTQTKSDAA